MSGKAGKRRLQNQSRKSGPGLRPTPVAVNLLSSRHTVFEQIRAIGTRRSRASPSLPSTGQGSFPGTYPSAPRPKNWEIALHPTTSPETVRLRPRMYIMINYRGATGGLRPAAEISCQARHGSRANGARQLPLKHVYRAVGLGSQTT